MAEETGKEEMKETHAIESEEQIEIEDEGFEPGIKEPQKAVPIVQDHELNVLPENDEENENILLTSRTLEKAKPKMSSRSKARSSRLRRVEIKSASVRMQLERQTVQIDKIRSMLQPLLKETKSTQGQSKLIKQLQLQVKQLQNQVTQIHKSIAKSSPIKTTPARKKNLNPRKLKKKR
jgi:hypothetical protein